MYNPVGSPRLKTASPINQNKIIPRLRLPSTDPVWARRFKPTRPAGAEHPPLSPSSPHAAEPLGSWSPDFSVRVVTQARGGAGRKQNGLPRQLAGVPAATQTLQSFYFSCKGPKPAATQGLPRGKEWASPRRKGTIRLFLSPPSFFFTHEKERRGAGCLTGTISPWGGAPHTCMKPDRT